MQDGLVEEERRTGGAEGHYSKAKGFHSGHCSVSVKEEAGKISVLFSDLQPEERFAYVCRYGIGTLAKEEDHILYVLGEIGPGVECVIKRERAFVAFARGVEHNAHGGGCGFFEHGMMG